MPPFSRTASTLRRSAAHSRPGRSQKLETAFCSPAATTRYRAAETGSTLPTCFFVSPPSASRDRSASDSRLPPSPERADPHRSPVSRSTPGCSEPPSRPSLPSGVLPPRDHSTRSGLGPEGLPLVAPASLSLPLAASITQIRPGSSFQERYASFGSLFLRTSWNLFHHAPKPFCSQILIAIPRSLSSGNICFVDNRLPPPPCEYHVDKTAPVQNVLTGRAASSISGSSPDPLRSKRSRGRAQR